MKQVIYIFAILFFVLNTNAINPAYTPPTKDTRSYRKALYIYNFATMVEWPKTYKAGKFIIGVYGESAVYDQLKKNYTGKKIGSQPIEIRRYDVLPTHNIHILFVTETKSKSISNINKSLSGKSTLLITETPGLLKKGGVINFIVNQSKQVYELSVGNAKKKKLALTSRLQELAFRKE